MNRSSLAVAALALATLAGCGGDSGGGGGTPRSGIVYLHDTTYAQFDVTDTGSEGSNVEAVLGNGTDLFGVSGLNGLNLQFTQFATADTATLKAAIAGKKTLVIPEQEVRSWAGDLDFSAVTALREFVASGGNIVVWSNDNGSVALADAVLGSALQSRYIDYPAEYFQDGTRTTAAAGTPFASGPTTLRTNDAIAVILKDSLPAGSVIAYEWGGDALVAVIPKGSGHILLFAWDFFIDLPDEPDTQISNWVDAFEIAVTKY